MDERLTKIEMLYSDLSRTVEDMSSEMFQQQKEIVQLKQQIKELEDRLDSAANEIGGSERPPHY